MKRFFLIILIFQGIWCSDLVAQALFTPVFSYVKELQEKKELTHLEGLLYFTDGDGIYPTSPPPYETAFVFTDFSFLNYPVPAFITKLCLETNQAGNEVFQYEH